MAQSDYNYLQNLDIWKHILTLSFEKALNSLLKVNKTFQTLVEKQYEKLFDESTHNLSLVYENDRTILRWFSFGFGEFPQELTRDEIDEILHGRYRKGHTTYPGPALFRFVFEHNRLDSATTIFRSLSPFERGIITLSELSSTKTFARCLQEKNFDLNLIPISTDWQKIAQLCELVSHFPKKRRRYYVERFLTHMKHIDCYDEYRKRYL